MLWAATEAQAVLFAGLATQYHQGTLRDFTSDEKVIEAWITAMAQARINKADVFQFLKQNVENATPYNELSMGFIMNWLKGVRDCRLQNQKSAAAKSGGVVPQGAERRLGRDTSREMAERGIAAMRAAIRGSKAKPEPRKSFEYLDVPHWVYLLGTDVPHWERRIAV